MQFIYHAQLDPDPDGGFIVVFPAVPECITAGTTRSEGLANAREALGMALLGYILDGKPLPDNRPSGDLFPIAPLASDAAKLAVIQAFQEAGISKSELARRLGVAENEARRILDPKHATRIERLDAALSALGKQLSVGIEPAAA